MKKALTILLAVAMMFCFSATAFAADFNDTDKCSDVAKDAINKVAALGIVEGYEDGGFHPTANITRAEFAKMADIAAGLEESANKLQDADSSYSDVKSGAWYTGWINLASSQGFVKGYPNGTFGPNNTITYAEVVTVVMRLLGYNDNLTGPWPINYINQAIKLDILEDVENFSANAPATRSDVAIILAAALDTEMVKWDKDTEEFVGKDVTLLEDSFGDASGEYVFLGHVVTDAENGEYEVSAVDMDEADKIEDAMAAVRADYEKAIATAKADRVAARQLALDEYNVAMTLAGDDTDKQDAAQAELEEALAAADEAYEYAEEAAADKAEAAAKKAFGKVVVTFDCDADTAVAGMPVYLLAAHDVTIIADEDGNASYIQDDSDIIEVEEAEETAAGKIKLDGKTYTIEDSFFESVDEFEADDCNEIGYAMLNRDGEVRVADTDYYIGEDLFGYIGVVTDVDTDDEDAYEVTVNDDETYAADADDVILVKDGERIAATDLKAGDVLVVGWSYIGGQYDAESVNVIIGVVSNPSIKGEVSKVKKDTVTIGGNDYVYAADRVEFNGDYEAQDSLTAWNDLYGDEVSVYVSNCNEIHYVVNDNEDAPDNYAILTGRTWTASGWANENEITALTLYTADGTKEIAVDDDKVDQATLKDLVKGEAYTYKLNKDNEITAIQRVESKDFDTLTVVDNKRVKVDGSNYNFADNAIIFNVEDDYEVSKLTAKDILANDTVESAAVKDGSTTTNLNYIYAVIEKGEIAFMAVTNFGGKDSVDYAVVSDAWVADDDVIITFAGDSTEYIYDGEAEAAYELVDQLVSYDVTGKDVSNVVPVRLAGPYNIDTYKNGMVTQTDGQTFEVTEDTLFYVYEDGKFTVSTEANVVKAKNDIKVVVKENKDKTAYEADVVVLMK